MALSRLDRHVSLHDASIGIGTPICMTTPLLHDNATWRANSYRRRELVVWRFSSPRNAVAFNARRCASVATLPSRSTLGAILLFTMSDITRPHQAVRPGDGSGIVFYGRAEASIPHRPMRCESNLARSNLWKRSNPGKSSSSRVKAIIAASIAPHSTAPLDIGGARRDRTDDLLLAKQALSQLSYGPSRAGTARAFPTTDFRSLIPETGGPGKT
jgi:hypothetical protein